MNLITIDLMCPKCEYEEERSIDLRGKDSEEDRKQAMIVQCPNCEHPQMDRVWRRAPSIGGPKYGSDAEIAKMKNSFNQRFIKKELDDVRNKFGKLYDDNVRSVAADRIKKEIKGGSD